MLGKGATNHLHRREVVDALRARGVKVTFLVREDYLSLLKCLPGCEYRRCGFAPERGGLARWRGLLRYLRGLYPAADPGVRAFHRLQNRAHHNLRQRMLHSVYYRLARYRWIMRVVVVIERFLYRTATVEGVDPAEFDQLLVLGLGITGTQLEGTLTWWARANAIPVVYIVGNYDNLSSQGFRGVPVDTILVWGESMRDDAVELHAIAPHRVHMIGVIRYDAIERVIKEDRATFMKSHGLDSGKKTILFAGSMPEFHYFEALAALKQLREEGEDLQMILRIYPNKGLMRSVYIEPLIEHAERMPGVYVSLADTHYRSGEKGYEVLQIEETELWHALKYSDVVVNLYSTIALEACIFDKPAIHIWYFSPAGQLAVAPAVYGAYPSLIHNRRLLSYGAIRIANNRPELLTHLREALRDPGRFHAERMRTVARECGVLDGQVCKRLAAACVAAYNRGSPASQPVLAAHS